MLTLTLMRMLCVLRKFCVLRFHFVFVFWPPARPTSRFQTMPDARVMHALVRIGMLIGQGEGGAALDPGVIPSSHASQALEVIMPGVSPI